MSRINTKQVKGATAGSLVYVGQSQSLVETDINNLRFDEENNKLISSGLQLSGISGTQSLNKYAVFDENGNVFYTETGPQGPQGTQGIQGATGNTLNCVGYVVTNSTLPSSYGEIIFTNSQLQYTSDISDIVTGSYIYIHEKNADNLIYGYGTPFGGEITFERADGTGTIAKFIIAIVSFSNGVYRLTVESVLSAGIPTTSQSDGLCMSEWIIYRTPPSINLPYGSSTYSTPPPSNEINSDYYLSTENNNTSSNSVEGEVRLSSNFNNLSIGSTYSIMIPFNNTKSENTKEEIIKVLDSPSNDIVKSILKIKGYGFRGNFYVTKLLISDSNFYTYEILVKEISGLQERNNNIEFEETLSGTDGAQGTQGLQGFQGNQGIQGPQGNAGQTGAQGNQGPQGLKGYDGYLSSWLYDATAGGYYTVGNFDTNSGWNNTITLLRFNNEDSESNYWPGSLWNTINNNSIIKLVSQEDPSVYGVFRVTKSLSLAFPVEYGSFNVEEIIKVGSPSDGDKFNVSFVPGGFDYYSQSSSSISISTGSKTVLVNNEGFVVGQTVKIEYDSNNWLIGEISGITGETSLTVIVTEVKGSGTQSNWSVYLVGKTGAQGNQGLQGPQGNVGETGAQGNQGLQGPQGNVGETGAQGNQGLQGPQGNVGETGAQGNQGLQGPQGNVGQTGAQGNQGLQGPQGNVGETGAQGNQGLQGPQGNVGETGAQGNQGLQGPQGNVGQTGAQGNQGLQGPQGNVGETGAQGNQGLQGPQGNVGQTGAQGNQGLQGPQGNVGVQGPEANNALEWVTKSANYTMNVGEAVMADTSSGSFTLTLPLGPSVGDMVGISDKEGTFNSNNLTIGRNSSKIQGLNEDLVLDVADTSFNLVYSGTTLGWKLDTYLVPTADNSVYSGYAQISNSTSTSVTPSLSDAGKFYVLDNASPITFTIGSNEWIAGQEIYMMQKGAGEVSISMSGPSLLYPSGFTASTSTQNSVIGAKCLVGGTAGTWVAFGNLKTE